MVREITQKRDVYKFFKMPRTEMNKAFMGVLGTEDWGRVTIHVLEDVIYSYTVWVPTESLIGVKEGVAVLAEFRRLDVPNKAREWVCKHLQSI